MILKLENKSTHLKEKVMSGKGKKTRCGSHQVGNGTQSGGGQRGSNLNILFYLILLPTALFSNIWTSLARIVNGLKKVGFKSREGGHHLNFLPRVKRVSDFLCTGLLLPGEWVKRQC